MYTQSHCLIKIDSTATYQTPCTSLKELDASVRLHPEGSRKATETIACRNRMTPYLVMRLYGKLPPSATVLPIGKRGGPPKTPPLGKGGPPGHVKPMSKTIGRRIKKTAND